MADEDKDLTQLFEETDPSSNCLLYIVIDPDGVPKPRKSKLENVLGAVGGGSYGDLVDKTISGGVILLNNNQHFVALTGEGDVADELTSITKTGGGYLDVGFVVTLTGKAGLAYTITVADAGNFKLQRVFSINNEYDSISLIHRGGGIWQEKGGRVNAG